MAQLTKAQVTKINGLKRFLSNTDTEVRWGFDAQRLLFEVSTSIPKAKKNPALEKIREFALDPIELCPDCHQIYVKNAAAARDDRLWCKVVDADLTEKCVCLNCSHKVIKSAAPTVRPYWVYKYTESPSRNHDAIHYELADGGSVLNYMFKANSLFKPQNPNNDTYPKFMGVEYETVFDLDLAHQLVTEGLNLTLPFDVRLFLGSRMKRALQAAIFKSDSSMEVSGEIPNGWPVEIVTAPGTFEWHRQVWKDFWSDPLAASIATNTTCGMHVHLSRATMTNATLAKLITFWNGNDMHAPLTVLCGRNSDDTSYGRRNSDAKLTTIFNPDELGRGVTNLGGGGGNTIELRGFASPKDYWQFAVRLELARASADFCATVGFRDITPTNFLSWLGKRHEFRLLRDAFEKWNTAEMREASAAVPYRPRDGRGQRPPLNPRTIATILEQHTSNGTTTHLTINHTTTTDSRR